MAASGFTPISLYYSTTAAAVPTSGNLANGELGLNIADMKLYAKNSAGTVTLLASSGGAAGTVSSVAVSGGTTGLTTSGGPITTSGTITLAGTLATANGGTGLTSFTSGGVVYASSSSALATGSALTFDGTDLLLASGGLFDIDSTNAAVAMRIRQTTVGAGTEFTTTITENTGVTFDSSDLAGATARSFVWTAAGTEGMRLTSTGLGIGTSSPTAKIETYKSSAGVWAKFAGVNVSEVSELNIGTDADDANNTVYIATNNTTGGQRFSIRMGGTTSTYDVASFFNGNGFSVGTTAAPGAGAIYATGNITAYYSSDIKFKENVRDIPDALATVNAIGGKLFDWTDDYIESKGGADGYFVQKADFGVVAQDVQKVFPIAVRTREDGSLAVDYEKLGALAFAALVELTKRVEALESK
jgi:hypothetical protein